MIEKSYKTIKGEAKSLLIVNKSKFIGHAVNINKMDDVNDILKRIKKKYSDANHNCFAYIIGKNSEHMKYSDDGEPSGTAGVPMLEVLKKSGLTDILVISTRYFGGIKLGAGGLVRAYSSSVSETLKNAEKQKFVPCEIFNQAVDYDIWAKIEPKVIKMGAIIFKQDYLEKVYLEIGLIKEVKEKVFNIFKQALKSDRILEYMKTDYVESNADGE